MIITHITLKNWRNFQSVDIDLRDRLFLVGPNASGKSNFLDALRFLRDLAKDGRFSILLLLW
jgi:predicted ATPase